MIPHRGAIPDGRGHFLGDRLGHRHRRVWGVIPPASEERDCEDCGCDEFDHGLIMRHPSNKVNVNNVTPRIP